MNIIGPTSPFSNRNGVFDSSIIKQRCFTSSSLKRKETMQLHEKPRYKSKDIQNCHALVSLKINSDEITEFQRPTQNTLTNLRQSQFDLQLNSASANKEKSSKLIFYKSMPNGFNIIGNPISSKEKGIISPFRSNNKSFQQNTSSFSIRNSIQATGNQHNFDNTFLEDSPKTSFHFSHRKKISSNFFNDNEETKKKEPKHLFQLHSHLLLSKNQNIQYLYDHALHGYKSIFSIDWLEVQEKYKEKGFDSLNLMLVDLQTQKYNIYRNIKLSLEKPSLFTPELIKSSIMSTSLVWLVVVFVESEPQKGVCLQEIIIEKMMVRNSFNGYSKFPVEIEKAIMLFYFLLVFTLDGHMERETQVAFALSKVHNFIDLKNQSSVQLSLHKRLAFQAINRKTMLLEDSFRKTFSVDLVRIIGEQIHKGLLYSEQGEEIFKKINLYSYQPPSFNIENQISTKTSTTRPLNERRTFTQAEIVLRNKQKKEEMSQQKIFREPKFLKLHSQQIIRETKPGLGSLSKKIPVALKSSSVFSKASHHQSPPFSSSVGFQKSQLAGVFTHSNQHYGSSHHGLFFKSEQQLVPPRNVGSSLGDYSNEQQYNILYHDNKEVEFKDLVHYLNPLDIESLDEHQENEKLLEQSHVL